MLDLLPFSPVCLKTTYVNPFHWKELSENLTIK